MVASANDDIPGRKSERSGAAHAHASVTRQLNLVFLIGLLTVLIVLGGATYFVHGFQVQRNAAALLDRAHKAESQGDLAKAVETLNQYLNLKRDDGETWRWYTRLVDDLHADNLDRRLNVLYGLRGSPTQQSGRFEARGADAPSSPLNGGRRLKPRVTSRPFSSGWRRRGKESGKDPK